MDILTFTSEILKSIAWPITVLILIFFLRSHLNELFLAIRKIRWGEIEAEFGKDLEQARALLEGSTKDAPQRKTADGDKSAELLLKLANASPRAAVLEAWRQVELAAEEALRNRDRTGGLSRRPAAVGSALHKVGILDDAEFQVFSILRELRNRAAHEHEFKLSPADAAEYTIMAQRLGTQLTISFDGGGTSDRG